MNKKLPVAFFLSACCVLSAQVAAVDVPYQKFVLKNGLTLLVHEDRKAPIVAVNVWYHVGSKNERPGKTGFAHLFEHLMFGGSEHHQRRDRKSTRLNSSHQIISYAVFCLKKKKATVDIRLEEAPGELY